MNSLTCKPVHPRLAKWLDDYVLVFGREPSADEIATFEQVHGLTNTRAPVAADSARSATA